MAGMLRHCTPAHHACDLHQNPLCLHSPLLIFPFPPSPCYALFFLSLSTPPALTPPPSRMARSASSCALCSPVWQGGMAWAGRGGCWVLHAYHLTGSGSAGSAPLLMHVEEHVCGFGQRCSGQHACKQASVCWPYASGVLLQPGHSRIECTPASASSFSRSSFCFCLYSSQLMRVDCGQRHVQQEVINE